MENSRQELDKRKVYLYAKKHISSLKSGMMVWNEMDEDVSLMYKNFDFISDHGISFNEKYCDGKGVPTSEEDSAQLKNLLSGITDLHDIGSLYVSSYREVTHFGEGDPRNHRLAFVTILERMVELTKPSVTSNGIMGAIIGDIAGSRFEFDNYRKKDFTIFSRHSYFTDDTVMTLAVAKAIQNCYTSDEKVPEKQTTTFKGLYGDALSAELVRQMQKIGRPYPHCGYGGSFRRWMYSDNPQPYGSYGNGAAMRASACGMYARIAGEAVYLGEQAAAVSHDHEEGIKGSEATAVCVFLAKTGKDKEYIRDYVNKNYYKLDFTIDQIRPTYKFNETCQGTVPQAIEAFLESTSFEDAIRTAVSVGGDSDTLAAITGGIAGAYYGVPDEMQSAAEGYLDERLLKIYREVEKKM